MKQFSFATPSEEIAAALNESVTNAINGAKLQILRQNFFPSSAFQMAQELLAWLIKRDWIYRRSL